MARKTTAKGKKRVAVKAAKPPVAGRRALERTPRNRPTVVTGRVVGRLLRFSAPLHQKEYGMV